MIDTGPIPRVFDHHSGVDLSDWCATSGRATWQGDGIRCFGGALSCMSAAEHQHAPELAAATVAGAVNHHRYHAAT